MARIQVYTHRCTPALLSKLGYKGDAETAPFLLEVDVDAATFAEVRKTKGALSKVIGETPAIATVPAPVTAPAPVRQTGETTKMPDAAVTLAKPEELPADLQDTDIKPDATTEEE